jgi:hypothetical protein
MAIIHVIDPLPSKKKDTKRDRESMAIILDQLPSK